MSTTIDTELFRKRLIEERKRVQEAIDAALTRMDDGSYAVCVSCGQPIGAERLEALPWTTQCIDCKRKEERG